MAKLFFASLKSDADKFAKFLMSILANPTEMEGKKGVNHEN